LETPQSIQQQQLRVPSKSKPTSQLANWSS